MERPASRLFEANLATKVLAVPLRQVSRHSLAAAQPGASALTVAAIADAAAPAVASLPGVAAGPAVAPVPDTAAPPAAAATVADLARARAR